MSGMGDKTLKKKFQIIVEIVETERSYVRDMKALVEVFMKPLRAQLNAKFWTPVLSKAEMTTVFSIADQLVFHFCSPFMF